MKPLQQSDSMLVVHRGEDWPYAQNPCAKDMMKLLEKNERYVSWLQPPSKTTDDQIPALRIQGKYYHLSLRMMKCIWKHVRLHKGFCNHELALYGGQKLKIPRNLYEEKIRTQRRFNVSITVMFGMYNPSEYKNDALAVDAHGHPWRHTQVRGLHGLQKQPECF